jgi:hypothetical protein
MYVKHIIVSPLDQECIPTEHTNSVSHFLFHQPPRLCTVYENRNLAPVALESEAGEAVLWVEGQVNEDKGMAYCNIGGYCGGAMLSNGHRHYMGEFRSLYNLMKSEL